MSYLIIGNDLISLYYAKLLKDLGWKVTLITNQKFDYGAEYCLADDVLLDKLGIKYRLGLIKNVTYVEVIDINNNSRFFDTYTKLVDMGIYKNQLFGDVRRKIEYYEDTSFIDKHGENVFIKVASRGVLHKSRYVLNFEDIELSNKLGNDIKQKTHLYATVKRKNPKTHLTIFFFKDGYGWISNFAPEHAHLSMFGENLEKELERVLKDFDLELVTKAEEKIPIFNPNVVAQKGDIYLGGRALGITNNLNMDWISPNLDFANEFKMYYHKLMTGNAENYDKLVQPYLKEYKEQNKLAKVFWGANEIEKNDMLHYYNPRFGVLDFKSIFKNLPTLSKHRVKLLFS